MLTRWDPFREMLSLRNRMDRLFDRAYDSQMDWPETTTLGLALDVAEQENEFIVKASVPGINPNDLEITFNDNILTIKGEINADKEIKEDQYHLRERRFGSFSRSISLPTRVRAENIQANYEAGILTLTLPKAEEVKPKKIAIHVGNGKMLDAKVAKK